MNFFENKNYIENINQLKFRFSINERFIYAKNDINKYFEFESPFLKVLKPIHVTYNKKKTISKKYLILETNEDVDFNNEINNFIYNINKIHEISQERIKEKSLSWFNTEFDEIGLDLKIRRPIEQHKNSEFIKISIPLDNHELEEKISKLSKGDYILCNLLFKGLKVSSDFIVEDIEIKDFITQKEYDDIQNYDINNDSIFLNNEIIEDNDLYTEVNNFENNSLENNILENNNLQNNSLENNSLENNNLENNNLENNDLENNDLENNILENNTLENNNLENNNLKNNNLKNNNLENNNLKNNNLENNNLENIEINNNKIKKNQVENKHLEKKSKKIINDNSKVNNNIKKNIKNNINIITKKNDLIKKISKKLIFT